MNEILNEDFSIKRSVVKINGVWYKFVGVIGGGRKIEESIDIVKNIETGKYYSGKRKLLIGKVADEFYPPLND